jgi:hypothetical protein
MRSVPYIGGAPTLTRGLRFEGRIGLDVAFGRLRTVDATKGTSPTGDQAKYWEVSLAREAR